jgi:hypothetical protein
MINPNVPTLQTRKKIKKRERTVKKVTNCDTSLILTLTKQKINITSLAHFSSLKLVPNECVTVWDAIS